MKVAKAVVAVLLACVLTLTGTTAFSQQAPGDLQYKREKVDDSNAENYPPSIFQHWIHRIRFRCDACHDSLFKMKRGGTPVTHDLMKKGKLCSTCHNGKIAFDAGFKNCFRCHVTEEK